MNNHLIIVVCSDFGNYFPGTVIMYSNWGVPLKCVTSCLQPSHALIIRSVVESKEQSVDQIIVSLHHVQLLDSVFMGKSVHIPHIVGHVCVSVFVCVCEKLDFNYKVKFL